MKLSGANLLVAINFIAKLLQYDSLFSGHLLPSFY